MRRAIAISAGLLLLAAIGAWLVAHSPLERPRERPPVGQPVASDVDRFVQLQHFGTHAWAVAFSPDGDSVLSGGYEGAHLWSLADGSVAKAFAPQDPACAEGVNEVAFETGGRHATVGFKEGGSFRWDLDADTRIPVPQPARRVARASAVSPDGKLLARASGAQITLCALPGEDLRATLVHEDGVVSSLCFSPDGSVLASASAGRPDGARDARLWDVATGTELRRLPWDGGYVWDVAFRPDGRALAVGGEGGITLWGLAP